MFRLIDKLLNWITMYRLVLYYLIGLWLAALGLSFFGRLSYQPLQIIFSAAIILVVCWLTNKIFSHIFNAQANLESIYITVLILALIITPLKTAGLDSQFWFLIWASIWAMASKYIFAVGKKHLFNPAAFAVVLTGMTLHQAVSWWVGTASLLPFVVIGGLLVVKKILRFDLVTSFLITAAVTIIGFGLLRGADPLLTVQRVFLNTGILFFAFVMLTEPLTTPPTRGWRLVYGALVGFLFAPAVHIGSLYSSPELALVVGNLLAYVVSPKTKLLLALRQKINIAPDIYNFVFRSDKSMQFKPGQYLEWTLGHRHPDARGNRRYFTIASSPTEPAISIGVKFNSKSSSFKHSLLALEPGDTIVASQLAGEFTLPKNPNQRLVFIAGGIGITPFRSMIKYLVDRDEQRSIVLFYSAKTESDIVYKDVFQQAHEKLGIETVYTLTDLKAIPKVWPYERGYINERMILKYVPDYHERFFYLSGPRSLVTAFEDVAKKIGVQRSQIKTDFFPGFV